MCHAVWLAFWIAPFDSALRCNLPGGRFEGMLGCIKGMWTSTITCGNLASVHASALTMCQVMPCMAMPCTIPALPWCLHFIGDAMTFSLWQDDIMSVARFIDAGLERVYIAAGPSVGDQALDQPVGWN